MSTDQIEHPETGHRSRRGLVWPAIGALVVIVAAVLAWAFLAGPLSERARAEKDVAEAVTGLRQADTLESFNSRLCAEYRAPEDLIRNISAAGESTGSDVDRLFRESMLAKFPEDLRVTSVEVDGDEATADTVSAGGATERVHMRREDGQWKVCQPGVGMGSVPGN